MAGMGVAQLTADAANPRVPRPLEGVRVVDLSHAIAGPMCTYHLQLLGADVIKVERPGEGDDFRARVGPRGVSASFVAINGGKRSATLDLKQPAGLAALRRMIDQADVLVENYRPGVTTSLGLDWNTVRQSNPRLVYCSITGYGQHGALRAQPAIEWAVQAASGMTASYVPAVGDMSQLGLMVLDPFSGYVGFSGVLAALLQRERTGLGQYVEVAMMDAAMVLMAPAVASQQLDGASGRHGYSESTRRPTMGRFRTRDGVIFVGAALQKTVEALYAILGVPELAQDERYATAAGRSHHFAQVRERLESLIATWSAADLEQRLNAAGCPASVVRTLQEALDLPHVQDRQVLVETEVAGLDEPVRVVGSGFQLASGGPALNGPVPSLGEHTDVVLRDFGFKDDEIAALRAQRAI